MFHNLGVPVPKVLTTIFTNNFPRNANQKRQGTAKLFSAVETQNTIYCLLTHRSKHRTLNLNSEMEFDLHTSHKLRQLDYKNKHTVWSLQTSGMYATRAAIRLCSANQDYKLKKRNIDLREAALNLDKKSNKQGRQ